MKNNDVIDTIETGKYFAQIILDSDPGETPRDWDNLGTMVCFHNRYNLGDYDDKTRKTGKGDNTFRYPEYFEEWYNENKNDIAVILPLYLYDHSGLSISTGSFHDIFDSCQVGFIFVTKEEVRKEYSCKIVTKKNEELAEKVLMGEVESYDQYLRGDIYGYKLFKIDPEQFEEGYEFDSKNDDPEEYGEEVDSCWGFYGIDSVKEEINNMIEWHKEKDAEQELKDQESDWANLPVKESLMQES